MVVFLLASLLKPPKKGYPQKRHTRMSRVTRSLSPDLRRPTSRAPGETSRRPYNQSTKMMIDPSNKSSLHSDAIELCVQVLLM